MYSLIRDELTVIIPLYKKSESIKRAIHSVLNQKILPKSIIVVDDGSMDESSRLIRKMQSNHSIIKLIEQKNMGVSSKKNRGVMESETEFIAFLDTDDEWLPEHTFHLWKVISENKEADFYSIPFLIQSSKGVIKPHVALSEDFSGTVSNFVKTYSNGYGIIHSSSVCFRRLFFFRTGGFPQRVENGGATYLWIKAGLEGDCATINKRSVLVHQEEVGYLERIKEDLPYHISYFIEHLEEYTSDERFEIKRFLRKNIFLLWAAAKIENNTDKRNYFRTAMFNINKVQWFILLFSELIPAQFFKIIRKRQISRMLNS